MALSVSNFTGDKFHCHKQGALLWLLTLCTCRVCVSPPAPEAGQTSASNMVPFVLLTNSQMCLGLY